MAEPESQIPPTDKATNPLRTVTREIAGNIATARKWILFDCAILVVGCVLFLLNNHVLKPMVTASPYEDPFARIVFFHLNDFIGGCTFVAYVNLLFDIVRPTLRMKRLATMLVLILFCGLFWEYVVPLFLDDSFTDPTDLVAYLLGACLYWLISRIFSRKIPIAEARSTSTP